MYSLRFKLCSLLDSLVCALDPLHAFVGDCSLIDLLVVQVVFKIAFIHLAVLADSHHSRKVLIGFKIVLEDIPGGTVLFRMYIGHIHVIHQLHCLIYFIEPWLTAFQLLEEPFCDRLLTYALVDGQVTGTAGV